MLSEYGRANILELTGDVVSLKPFDQTNLTPEYLGWLRDPELMKYSNQRFREHDLTSCQRYLDSFRESGNQFFAIYFQGLFAGTMTAYLTKVHKTADMGLMIGAQCRGKGLGRDAWKTLMEHLLQTGTRKVTGGTLRCNRVMVRIMESSGMQADGVRTAHELVDGVPHDILHFARFQSA
jgi:RimJ/RimL family protein N-acetyltransferase